MNTRWISQIGSPGINYPSWHLVVNIFSSATDSVMQKLINFSLQQHPLVLGYLALALFIGACLFACLYTLNVLRVQHAVRQVVVLMKEAASEEGV